MREGEWQRLAIDGEMLTDRSRHVIYFANEDTWRRYPAWARDRREEVITRIKGQSREPDYEYAGGGIGPPPAPRGPRRPPAAGLKLKSALGRRKRSGFGEGAGGSRVPPRGNQSAAGSGLLGYFPALKDDPATPRERWKNHRIPGPPAVGASVFSAAGGDFASYQSFLGLQVCLTGIRRKTNTRISGPR